MNSTTSGRSVKGTLTFPTKKRSFLTEPPREVFLYFQRIFSLETGDTTSLQVSTILVRNERTNVKSFPYMQAVHCAQKDLSRFDLFPGHRFSAHILTVEKKNASVNA